MRRIACTVLGGIPAVVVALALVAGPWFVQPTPGADALPEGVPACVSDDYNDGSQVLCYTYTVQGEAVFINSADEVVPAP